MCTLHIASVLQTYTKPSEKLAAFDPEGLKKTQCWDLTGSLNGEIEQVSVWESRSVLTVDFCFGE